MTAAVKDLARLETGHSRRRDSDLKGGHLRLYISCLAQPMQRRVATLGAERDQQQQLLHLLLLLGSNNICLFFPLRRHSSSSTGDAGLCIFALINIFVVS